MNAEWNPVEEYSTRLAARRAAVERYDRWGLWVALSRLTVAVVFLFLGWQSFWRGAMSGWWLVVPAVVFFALIVVHARVTERKQRAMKAIRFYEDGLARIEDRWIGRGQSTELLRDESHLYAPDLDIFGPASLFELLSIARTRSGEVTLANWLSEPAGKDEILARQDAVRDLRGRLDLREDLAIAGSNVRSSIHPDEMTQWGSEPIRLHGKAPRIAALVLTVLVTGLLVAALALPKNPSWLGLYYAGLALQGVLWLVYGRRIREALEAVERPHEDLKTLSQMLARIEREQFESRELREMQSALSGSGFKSSEEITRLVGVVDMLTLKGLDVPVGFVGIAVAGIIVPLSLLVLLKLQIAFAVEAWRRRWGPSVETWISTVGRLEALCSLAAYAYEHPADPFPEIVDGRVVFDAEELGHPLMAAARCVPNSVRFDGGLQLLVVSGSNMSGKSTLLRSIGVNAVLAMAGAPVRASRMRLAPLAIGATIRIHDSLQAGMSRFYAEIQRIRQVMDLTDGDLPVLFLFDEILHGTNSHDRAIGAEAIVKALVARRTIGLVTTHDLALTRVAVALDGKAANVHFEDELKDGKLIFDYRMKPGVVQRSNALELMRAVGIEVQ